MTIRPDVTSHAVFDADMERMNAELMRLDAVRSTDDGFVYIDETKVSDDFLRVYEGLVQYGYANGLLP